MNKFLSKLSCSGPDLDKTKLTTEHNVVVDRSLCDNFGIHSELLKGAQNLSEYFMKIVSKHLINQI